MSRAATAAVRGTGRMEKEIADVDPVDRRSSSR
jgi:hypothetical protein